VKTLAPLRDVVDGQQRLRTVISFIAPQLLDDLDQNRDVFRISANHNEDFPDKSFKELPEDARRGILDYQFTVEVLPSDTDDREVKQIFARMNSSGYKLNAQELRNAEFFGAFKTRMLTLATEQLNRWRVWKIFSADDLCRMSEVELSSELVILMLNGISEKSDKLITKAYKDYDIDFKAGPEAGRRFRVIFDSIDQHFSDSMSQFRKRTIFYALFGAVYHLQFGIGSDLQEKKAKAANLTSHDVEEIKKLGARIAALTAPAKVMDATTRRTTHVRERKTLVNYLLRNT
jgi:uncharacterized protein with ParB-like and HNH nuclease domain